MFKTFKFVLTASAVATLVACGGGSGGEDAAPTTLKISGTVVDSAIAGAKVCLFADGVAVKDAAGTAVCSADTDANGAYALTVPASVVDAAQLTLRATKDAILLTSALGTKANAVSKSGGDGELTATELANTKVTHFTTADLVLADTDGNGFLSTSEVATVVDPAKRVQIASVIKAAVDYNQTALLGGTTTNTLLLAQAAAAGNNLGSTGAPLSTWYVDSANATVISAVTSEVAATAPTGGSTTAPTGGGNYRLTETLISYTPDSNNFVEGFYCNLGDNFGTGAPRDVQVTLDAAAGTFSLTVPSTGGDEGGSVSGSYSPVTYAIAFSESESKGPTGVPGFSTASSTSFTGSVNPVTGTITGQLSESTTNYRDSDNATRTCSGVVGVTLTKQ
jgi:hypothetical protein